MSLPYAAMDPLSNTLILRSIATTSISRAPTSPALYSDLLAMCEDYAHTPDCTDFWGTTPSGTEWRVILTNP